MRQKISIPPSLDHWLRSCEKNFGKWCFEEEEEGEEGRKFCQIKSVQHKIITNDNFSTEFFLFAKTTLFVCIDTITFQKDEIFVFTRLLFWQSQKLILLFVITIPQSFMLPFSHIWMIWMVFYQCHNMNNNADAQKHIILTFCLDISLSKTNIKLHCVECWFTIETLIFLHNSKRYFVCFMSYVTHYLSTKYNYPTFSLILTWINLIPIRFAPFLKWSIFVSKSADRSIRFLWWFLCFINLAYHSQCRHLLLLNRFWPLDQKFISLLLSKVVLTWSDKKNCEN